MFSDLLAMSSDELRAEARAVRDEAHGTRITFSPKVFIPLTMLCRDKCGYCTFAQPPARLENPYLSPEKVLAIAVAGADAGCHEALFTLGERPEERYPLARQWLDEHGYDSTVGYLAAMAELVRTETGLLPHANAGALHADELAALRLVAPSQGMMIESTNPDLECHRGSPDKTPERRLATLEAAGELAIPFTTGLLVGIGESEADRLETLLAIAASHRRHGHVQEVIVQNFLPKPGTSMHRSPPCPPDDLPRHHRPGPPRAPARDPPPGPAEPLRRLRRAARQRHRRLGRRLPRHRRPREPRAALAPARAAPRGHRGPWVHAGAAAHHLPRARAGAGPLARPGPALRRDGPLRRRGPRARRPGLLLPRADRRGDRGRHRRRGGADRPAQHRVVLRCRGRAHAPRAGQPQGRWPRR